MSEVAPTNRRDTAFESGNEERIQAVLAVAIENPEVIPGLISSLGWMEWATAEPHIRNLQASDSPLLRRIGLAASAIHRKDPGQALVDVIQSDDIPLKACALRAVGELGVRGLTNHLTSNFKSEVEELRFYAAWSATLLGDGYAAEVLKSVAEAKSRFAEKAIQAAMRRMDLTRAQDWLQDIIRSPRTRMAVIGAGILGDPSFVPWLLERMNIPILARVAGEAMETITGIDISSAALKGQKPEGFESGPTDDPEDEDVAMDPDDDLPWPDSTLLLAWWDKNKDRFTRGTRYFMGKPITTDHLKEVLQTGRQRQRAAAALELSMRAPGTPLFEVRAPGFRQVLMMQNLENHLAAEKYDEPEEDWHDVMMRGIREEEEERARRPKSWWKR